MGESSSSDERVKDAGEQMCRNGKMSVRPEVNREVALEVE